MHPLTAASPDRLLLRSEFLTILVRQSSCRPAPLQFELMRVDIETVSPLAAGQTVCDIWHQSSAPKNCRCGRSCELSALLPGRPPSTRPNMLAQCSTVHCWLFVVCCARTRLGYITERSKTSAKAGMLRFALLALLSGVRSVAMAGLFNMAINR